MDHFSMVMKFGCFDSKCFEWNLLHQGSVNEVSQCPRNGTYCPLPSIALGIDTGAYSLM